MRQLNYIVAAFMITGLISVSVFGLDQSAEKKEIKYSEVKSGAKEAAKTEGTYLYQKKEQYQKKAEENLYRFEENLKRLYGKAEKKGREAQEKISRAADDLREKSVSAKKKLKELKESGEGKWLKARTELDAMLKDLERSYQRTVAKFKD